MSKDGKLNRLRTAKVAQRRTRKELLRFSAASRTENPSENTKQGIYREENDGAQQQDMPMDDAPETPVSNERTGDTVLGATQGWVLIEKQDGSLDIVSKSGLDPEKYNNWDTKEPLNPPRDLVRAKALQKDGRFGEVTEVAMLTYPFSPGKPRTTVIIGHDGEELRLAKSEFDKLRSKSKGHDMTAQKSPTVVKRQSTPFSGSDENSADAVSSASIDQGARSVRFSEEASLASETVSSEKSRGTILGRWEKNHYATFTIINGEKELEIFERNQIDITQYHGEENLSVDLKNKGEWLGKSNISKDEFKQQWKTVDAAKYRHGAKNQRYVVWLQPVSERAVQYGNHEDSEDVFVNITTYVNLGGDKSTALELIKRKEEPSSKAATYTQTYSHDAVALSVEPEQNVPAVAERPENSIANQPIQERGIGRSIDSSKRCKYYIEARGKPRGATLNGTIPRPEDIWHLVRDENGNYSSKIGVQLAKEQANGEAEYIDQDKNVGYNPKSDMVWLTSRKGKFDVTDIQVLGMAGYMVKDQPIATVIFKPINEAIKKSLQSHRRRDHGDIKTYEYDGPVRCSWTTFKSKSNGKDEALSLLKVTDATLYAEIAQRASNSPSPRLRSRSRSQTLGADGSLEQKIERIFEKARLDVWNLVSKTLAYEVESGNEST